MKVLLITGDKTFKSGHQRFELQRSAVEELRAAYWGRGAILDALGVSGKFDVVSAQDPFWRGLVAWFVARRLRAKFNVQVHADMLAQSFVKRLLARFVLRRADSVRVVSKKIKDQVSAFGVSVPIHILPIYVDVSRFRLAKRQLHERPTILWVGRFESEKDPLLALGVLKSVRNEGIDAQLIMLGRGSMEQVLHKRAEDLPVEFPGWKDPLPFLEKADVVLCTSQEESWGASMVEALAAGVAVVAPDVGVAKEAGATVVPRDRLVSAVGDAITQRARGLLKLQMLSAEEWADAWKTSLL